MAGMPDRVSAKPTKPFDVNRLTDEQPFVVDAVGPVPRFDSPLLNLEREDEPAA